MSKNRKFIFINTVLFLVLFAQTVRATTTPTTTTPMLEAPALNFGSLIKGSDPKVYVFTADNQLHWIPDEVTFLTNGYSWTEITTLNDEVLNQFMIGEPLPVPTTLAEAEAAVKAYFGDSSIMVGIAKCESSFRQFNNDGTHLVGHGRYIGIFQIDENIHAAYAKSLGMDIYTVSGNLMYAKRLYENLGPQPWPTCAVKAAPAGALTKNLSLGDTDAEVKVLQQLLNSLGFNVADSGVGSAGNETAYFGSFTRAAVQRFQCAKNIVCSGSESTTGYGQVGPKTRAAFNN